MGREGEWGSGWGGKERGVGVGEEGEKWGEGREREGG